jgi:hypothetical protein
MNGSVASTWYEAKRRRLLTVEVEECLPGFLAGGCGKPVDDEFFQVRQAFGFPYLVGDADGFADVVGGRAEENGLAVDGQAWVMNREPGRELLGDIMYGA